MEKRSFAGTMETVWGIEDLSHGKAEGPGCSVSSGTGQGAMDESCNNGNNSSLEHPYNPKTADPGKVFIGILF